VTILGWMGWAAVALGAGVFVATSIAEKMWRAVGVAIVLFAPILGLFMVLLLADYAARPWIVPSGLIAGGLVAVLLTLPLGPNPRLQTRGEQEQVDEREAIFHRFYRLKPDTPEFEQYYSDHPGKLKSDNEIRQLPLLARPGSKTYHRLTSPFQIATFEVLEQITRQIDWEPQPVEERTTQATPEDFTRRIKGFARYLGADLVGTTRLNHAYVYSHVGRSPGKWGEPITLDHTHAVVFGVEMSAQMVRHAPDNATTTETAVKYFEAAKIAMLVARYINLLGYAARAHVDGNYRVLCAPIAADAGLGELGRLGLLITPRFGPRLRLSVVTTDLPLVQDQPIHFGVQHFCSLCKKCADCCPSASIDSGDKALCRGVEKWQSNQESCYHFWRVQGSDCSICVKVCPYSHPSTPLHNLVRWAVRRNALGRRVALWADDLFYGRRPQPCFDLPDWHAED